MIKKNHKKLHPPRPLLRDTVKQECVDTTPCALKERLEEYGKSGNIPFHMPGHKRRAFGHLTSNDLDITEIDGFDNLHNANGILKDAQDFASKVFDVKHTRFLINGSTCGVLASIKSVCGMKDTIVVARNCHKSVYNAIELLHLDAKYLEPNYCGDGFYTDINPDEVERVLSNCNAKMLVITSPTYEGVISDIKSIADICHKYGVTLFVDEAHGAHLSFADFEKSARHLGADIVVESVHKTLPALTQTALLHVCSDRVDASKIDKNLAIFESSSPSYLLLSSIDGCVHYLSNKGALDSWCANVDILRESLKGLKHITLLDNSDGKFFAYDKSKIVITCGACNKSGVEIAKILREQYHVECEMQDINHIILMSGAGDEIGMYFTLARVLKEIDMSLDICDCVKNFNLTKLPKKAVDSDKIDTLSIEYVKLRDSVGRVVANTISAYPPGAPIIVKGEIMSKEIAIHISNLIGSGVSIIGDKGLPEGIFVVKED